MNEVTIHSFRWIYGLTINYTAVWRRNIIARHPNLKIFKCAINAPMLNDSRRAKSVLYRLCSMHRGWDCHKLQKCKFKHHVTHNILLWICSLRICFWSVALILILKMMMSSFGSAHNFYLWDVVVVLSFLCILWWHCS